jgi:branched-chain amino acid transport system substrate-binding protein
LAALQVVSGDQEVLGTSNLRSIELALDERHYSLLGHPIELTLEDSLCSPEGGATAAAKVVADPRIAGILGPTCSGAAASAMKAVSQAGMVMVSGSSTAPSLTSTGNNIPGPDWQAGFYRTAQNDAFSGAAAATFARQELALSRAAIIDDGDPYTRGLATTFQQAFAAQGGEIVLETTVNKGDEDMKPVLTAVARSEADLVFLPVFRPEGDHLVLQARETEGLETATLMSAEGMYLDASIEAMGEAGVGLYLVIPIAPQGPAHDAFATRYAQQYGEVPSLPYYGHSYDAANLLLNALESVAVLSSDGTLQVGRQSLRDALYATSEFEGLTGVLTCDKYGDCGVSRFQIVRLDDPSAGVRGLASNVVYTYPPDH